MGKGWKNQRTKEVAMEEVDGLGRVPVSSPGIGGGTGLGPAIQPLPFDGSYPGFYPEPKDVKPQPLKRDEGAIDKSKALEVAQRPAVNVVRFKDGSVTLEFINIPNEQARRIVTEILPPALELYLSKSRDYGGNVMQQIKLGVKACIPDMQRKFGKLVDAIWWERQLKFEKPEEIAHDLLGHLLIFLDELKTGSSR